MTALAPPLKPGGLRVVTPSVVRALRPRDRVRTWDWVTREGRTWSGEPFDGERMPWAEGICDAFDHPKVREIDMMWGTRLGKTMISLEIIACVMANNPLPGIYGAPNEALAKRSIRNRVYKILESIEATRRQLLPPHLRSVRELRLAESTWAVVWSGSETLLADWSARYGYAGEVDKWNSDKGTDGEANEGDTLAQFEERLKEWPDRKLIVECSPSVKGRSRIGRKYQDSRQHQYQVPCPKCGKFQVLKLAGIIYDKLPDGTADAEIARQTARYACDHCRFEIPDELRPRMMRAGRWAPVGCYVDARGRVLGTPHRDSQAWGFQLASYYSLQLTWGDVAAKWVKAQGNVRLLQMFVNGWASEEWEPYKSKSDPEMVGERLTTDVPRGTVPSDATWLFAGVDVQDQYFVYTVVACGPGERCYLVDHGYCDSWDEVRDRVLHRDFPHEDGTASLRPALTLVDSGDGNRTHEIYRKCREYSTASHAVMPCKGANSNCNGEPYQKVTIGEGTKSGKRLLRRHALATRGVVLVRVNPWYWEPVIQKWLDETSPGEAESLSLPSGSDQDDDLLTQLCNAAQSKQPSKTDPDHLIWIPRWEDKPNDIRDAIKYARCAMEVKFRGDWRIAERPQASPPVVARATPTTAEPAESRGRSGRRSRIRERRSRRR